MTDEATPKDNVTDPRVLEYSRANKLLSNPECSEKPTEAWDPTTNSVIELRPRKPDAGIGRGLKNPYSFYWPRSDNDKEQPRPDLSVKDSTVDFLMSVFNRPEVKRFLRKPQLKSVPKLPEDPKDVPK